MKRAIFILLTIFTENSSMADTSALPTYEQAKKLAAAAWKSPPRSIDITYYSTVKDNTRTEEMFRKIYKDFFDDEYGPDEELSAEMLEHKNREIQNNVDSRLAEQRQTRKVRYRVRSDGKSCRIDKVDVRSERVIRKETAREEFQPEKKLDDNTPFEMTYIETPAEISGFELYHYSHKSKNLMIEKIEHSRTADEYRKISSILMMPNAMVLQMKLGTRNNKLAKEPYDINEPKIKQLCSGTLEGISVKIRPDPNEPDAKDRIEISLYNKEKIEDLTSLMICAKDDYSKVYYYQTTNPDTNKPPLFTRKCSNFDAQEFPHNVTQIIYDGKGDVRLQEIYKIEDFRVNIPIPKEVFDFNPPDGYIVTDYRLPETEMRAAKIESMKNALKGEKSSGRRLETIIFLREYLKDNPDELKDVYVSLLKDERDDIRRISLVSLIKLLKDDPEELRSIAISMKDDEDRVIQKLVAKILMQVESDVEN